MNVEESNMIPNGRSIWVQGTQCNMSGKDHGLTSMRRVTKIRGALRCTTTYFSDCLFAGQVWQHLMSKCGIYRTVSDFAHKKEWASQNARGKSLKDAVDPSILCHRL
ncbi:hypothetical protein RHMOL_Rhmol05G0265500 [Rhododendron molle]|uniref:Uncharacterized protein n=1 Tax=Rhododendron molle TaxID=49168 RepID=A0ACC0NUU5_RHOML|nr:hypothetical protein RHMOL_Rhmol05G0265500 [Rhododendron molle]